MTQKEINEFLANTKVYVNGKSKDIQEKLFSLGYKWHDGYIGVCHTEAPFLFIGGNKFLSTSSMVFFSNHKYREISAEEIFSLEITDDDNKVEGLVEEEVGLVDKFSSRWVNEFNLPEGYIFKDENGNIINATKIVLEKKHDDKLKLESTKKVREYWSEYARIFIEIYDDMPNECVLTHLYTLESHRQKGYGRQALSDAESIAKELGCHTAYLKVETDSWMHEWYLRCGYQWYENAPDNYTWLTKNL